LEFWSKKLDRWNILPKILEFVKIYEKWIYQRLGICMDIGMENGMESGIVKPFLIVRIVPSTLLRRPRITAQFMPPICVPHMSGPVINLVCFCVWMARPKVKTGFLVCLNIPRKLCAIFAVEWTHLLPFHHFAPIFAQSTANLPSGNAQYYYCAFIHLDWVMGRGTCNLVPAPFLLQLCIQKIKMMMEDCR
jgi:hypothetical protein